MDYHQYYKEIIHDFIFGIYVWSSNQTSTMVRYCMCILRYDSGSWNGTDGKGQGSENCGGEEDEMNMNVMCQL